MLTDPQELAGLLGIPYSAQQLDAITAPLTPGVIIAGAGSGKTTVMAARVVWLVGTGQVSAGQVLGLTFTRKAAAKLDQDVREALLTAALVDADAAEPVVLTYDAFAGQLVSDYGLLLGEEPTSRLITDATRYRLAARVVTDAVGPFAMLSKLQPATVVERVLRLAADMKSHLVGTDDILRHADRFATAVGQAPRRNTGEVYRAVQQADEVRAERLELLELVTSYERLKRELGYQEFSDQLATSARLIDEVPQVALRLRQDFRVVLLDEYQDTSSAQARLLRGLFSGADPSGGRGHAVTAVGDPCQAIYGWRGAAARNILDFATDFPLADGRPAPSFPLTVNRRSGPQILAAANRLADSVRSDPLLTGQQLDLELVAPQQAPPARIEARAYRTWPEETAALTDRIADLRSTAAVPSWKEMAVLCRNNSQVSAVYTALIERDIPAQIVGLGGLLDVPVIAEVVATLSVLADPTENPSLIRLLTSPRWAIGLPDLALLGKRAADLAGDRDVETPSLAEALADPGRAAYSALRPAERRVGRPSSLSAHRPAAIGQPSGFDAGPGGRGRNSGSRGVGAAASLPAGGGRVRPGRRAGLSERTAGLPRSGAQLRSGPGTGGGLLGGFGEDSHRSQGERPGMGGGVPTRPGRVGVPQCASQRRLGATVGRAAVPATRGQSGPASAR